MDNPDDYNCKIAELEAQIAAKDAVIKELDDRIKDLDTSLREVFRWDDSSRNQELITLKKDITSSLKLQYDDYQALLAMQMSEDTYKFSKATLTNIFRVLKRYGIEM